MQTENIYQPVEQAPFSIIETYVLTEMDLLFDRSVYRLYKSCEKKGFKFKMASIPKKMIKLFNVGYQMGKSDIPWKTKVAFDEMGIDIAEE